MKRPLSLFAASLLLIACSPSEETTQNSEPPIRGLKTVVVTMSEPRILRRFPSVLQPAKLSTLGFEIGGQVQAIDLRVGQIVKKGAILSELNDEAVNIQIASSEAAVAQARAASESSNASLKRQEVLLKSGTVTRAVVDNAKTDATSKAQSLIQAERALDSAKDNAEKTKLIAPFDGIISSVDAQPFSNVAGGAPITTLYRANEFEVSFTVNYDTVNRLTVGKTAILRLADSPDRSLNGIVTELGASADTVASFPVVISVQDAPQDIKSGMAVEVNLEFDLPVERGFTIPITAAVIEGELQGSRNPNQPTPLQMFVYDPETKTVQKRQVMVAGVRENSVLVISGLEAGERVASAGVSFLTDGQSVTLLED